MNDHRSQKSTDTNVPSWVLVAFALMLGVFIVGWSLSSGADRVPTGVARVVLDDGSVLVVRQLTAGWQELELAATTPNPVKVRPSQMYPRDGRFQWCLWLSRHDAMTGEPLALDGWTHSIAESVEGFQVQDDSAYRIIVHNGVVVERELRPFESETTGPYEEILYQSWIPMFRASGDDFVLRVHEVGKGKVASIRLPHSVPPGPFPTWSPSPLPIRSTDGDLTVDLVSISGEYVPEQSALRHLPRCIVTPKFLITQAGELTEEWSVQEWLMSDAMGREGWDIWCPLSPYESAWKLNFKLFRNDLARFDSSETLERTALSVPAKDEFVAIDGSFSVEGMTVSLMGISGSDSANVVVPSTIEPRTWLGTVGDDHDGPDVEMDFDGTNCHVSVDADRPFLVVRTKSETEDHRISMIATDRSGDPIIVEHEFYEGVHLFVMDTTDETGVVELTLIGQHARNVEFFVAPPSELRKQSVSK